MQLGSMSIGKRDRRNTNASVRLLSAEETSGDLSPASRPRSREDSLISNEDTSYRDNAIVRERTRKSDVTELAMQQGVVLIEDAIHYRSIHHKLDSFSIGLYQWYHSAPVQWCLYAVIFVLMFLAFLETPSSLTWSSDPRKNQTR